MPEPKLQPEDVLALLKESGFNTFLDSESKKPHCTITKDDGIQQYPSLTNKRVRHYISRLVREKLGRSINHYLLDQVVEELQAAAEYEGVLKDTAIRVAKDTYGFFLYDLGREDGNCIRISSKSWACEQTRYPFRHYAHTQAQPFPMQPGDINMLCELLNISLENRLLVLVYLVACFIPDISHPILLVTGNKGSAKTTFTRFLRTLIDPSVVSQTGLQSKVDEFAILATQHWCLSFDNVTWIKPETSDLLCKAVTGEAYAKRGLYTDDELVTMNFRRCILINGINVPMQKTDLLDRVLWIELPMIGPEHRKTDTELLALFEAYRPHILGGIFDTLAKAMAIKPTLKAENLHRMADFDLWGRAIAVALGFMEADFTNALEKNQRNIKQYTVTQNPIAQAIYEFLQTRDEWSGQATELLRQLTYVVQKTNPHIRMSHIWPKSPSALSQRIADICEELLEIGIHFERSHNGMDRRITLTKVEPPGGLKKTDVSKDS